MSTVILGHMMKSIFDLAEVATMLVQYCFIKYVNYKEKLQRVHYLCIREFALERFCFNILATLLCQIVEEYLYRRTCHTASTVSLILPTVKQLLLCRRTEVVTDLVQQLFGVKDIKPFVAFR